MPEAKLLKAYHLLKDPALDPGHRVLSLDLPMQLRGNAEYWLIVCPTLATELNIMNHMLSVPEGATEHSLATQTEKTWREWEEMIELLRVMIALPDLWESRFCSGIEGVLTPAERLSLPKAKGRVVWTGGDATPGRIGVVDWTNRVGAVIDV